MGIFSPEKGIAYCGLVCCVCSKNAHCSGYPLWPGRPDRAFGPAGCLWIQYHWPKQLVGDYDVLDREDEICAMVWENQLPNRQEGVSYGLEPGGLPL